MPPSGRSPLLYVDGSDAKYLRLASPRLAAGLEGLELAVHQMNAFHPPLSTSLSVSSSFGSVSVQRSAACPAAATDTDCKKESGILPRPGRDVFGSCATLSCIGSALA